MTEHPEGVFASVDALLNTMDLNPSAAAKAEIARILARKLDQSANVDGPLALATPGIAKELRGTLDEIARESGEADLFLADILGQGKVRDT